MAVVPTSFFSKDADWSVILQFAKKKNFKIQMDQQHLGLEI